MLNVEEELAQSCIRSESLNKLFKELEQQATVVLEAHQEAKVFISVPTLSRFLSRISTGRQSATLQRLFWRLNANFTPTMVAL